MHIFLYEWITGGGLVEQPGTLPASLLTEGTAMLSALAADFVAIEDHRVTVLRDMRLDELVLPGCDVVEIHSTSHQQDEIERLAEESTHVIVIAPEFDNILSSTVKRVERSAGNLLSPSSEFVAIASNKQRTADRITKAGVRAPEAILLEPDVENFPSDFSYPAVLKPLDGAGSQHTFLLTSPRDDPPPYPWPRRLEKFCPGTPLSVAFSLRTDASCTAGSVSATSLTRWAARIPRWFSHSRE